MATTTLSVGAICAAAERASRAVAPVPTSVKDQALEEIAVALEAQAGAILEANARDLEAARERDYPPAFLDKLALNPSRLAGMVAGVRAIRALPDPVGDVIDGPRLPNGLAMLRFLVPLGVFGIVYEARPNVTIAAT